MGVKWPYVLTAVVGIAVSGSAAWWYQSQAGTQRTPALPSDAGKKPGGGEKTAGVEVARVRMLELRDEVSAVGTLRSRQSVMLRPESAGRVRALHFGDGVQVRKGQVLVQLDDALQRAEVQQAQAQVSVAQANFKRNQELVAQNFVAQRVLDESSANLAVVQAQLAAAQARLKRMAIVAPFDGVTGLRLVHVGDYVRDGADLVNIEDTSRMLVDFRLPERNQSQLRVGQRVELALDAFPGRTFYARVEALDPLVDVNGRSVSVRAALASSQDGAVLRPGMFARVRVVLRDKAAVLMVPEEAVVPQAGKQYVQTVVAADQAPGSVKVPAGAQWIAVRQEVQLGLRRDGQVQISAGLSPDAVVVVAGQQRIQRDGTALKLVDVAAMAKPVAAPASSTPATR